MSSPDPLDPPLTLVGIVGSLRSGSLHRVLCEAAAQLLPTGASLVEVPLVAVPLYDGDVEAVGDPPAVEALKDAVAAADGVIVFTPEYNRSYPAVTKNALDWLSRRPGDNAIMGRPVGVVAGSPGGHEVAGVRTAMRDTLSVVRARPFESLGIPKLHEAIEDRVLKAEPVQGMLAHYLARFVAFVRAPDAAVD